MAALLLLSVLGSNLGFALIFYFAVISLSHPFQVSQGQFYFYARALIGRADGA